MPKKKTILSDTERCKRLQEAAEALETSEDPKAFERAFKKIVKTRTPEK
jgi:hypothetical protein